ncbi:hypothetical protein PO909_031967 [Leuciscus waleckii]
MQAEVKILVVLVAANLPNYNSGANIACLDLYVLSGHLLYHTQGVGPMAIPSIL